MIGEKWSERNAKDSTSCEGAETMPAITGAQDEKEVARRRANDMIT